MSNGEEYYKKLIEPIELQMMSVISRIVCLQHGKVFKPIYCIKSCNKLCDAIW